MNEAFRLNDGRVIFSNAPAITEAVPVDAGSEGVSFAVTPAQKLEYVQTTEEPPYLVKASEACRLLSISLNTLRTLVADGIIPEVRTLGGHRRYASDDLRKAVEKLKGGADV